MAHRTSLQQHAGAGRARMRTGNTHVPKKKKKKTLSETAIHTLLPSYREREREGWACIG